MINRVPTPGQERRSVAWSEPRPGKRNRFSVRLALAALAVLAMILTIGIAPATSGAAGGPPSSFVAAKLLARASSHPDERIRVIIRSRQGHGAAERAFDGERSAGDRLLRRLRIVGGVVVELKAEHVERLSRIPGLTITVDEPVRSTGSTSGQLWPYVSGNSMLWDSVDDVADPHVPTIAVVDSGLDANRPDFAGRVLADVDLATATPNSPGDGRGHGTFVAGIAAGAAADYAGAAPAAKLVTLDVMNDEGMAWTSDVIAAAEWILDNKTTYDIRVANFSLHTSAPSSFTVDPLDAAVEKLWFSGVVVVAAAGNYGTGGATDVKYAPANDPFVITVGAVDVAGTAGVADDFVAPWSTYGYTLDGFAKPELGAPGRYMVGPVPSSSTLVAERPGNVTAPGYMQLSGTSFAAPVVAGAAAHVLALHPEYTPDQVKGALMLTARPLAFGDQLAIGVGQVNAVQAATVSVPPNANLALYDFVVSDPAGGTTPVFDAASWNSAVQGSASWNSASWNSASWNSASWNSASWNSASWNSASWNSASWNSASWNSGSEADMVNETAAMVDANETGGYPLTALDLLAVASDPKLTPLAPLP